ncbi:hypothetical protein [Reyranella sp.]|uniref:hypothetical protein n=1 Tax=Reyranella sp. TaxID=1929291 RepID=UPI0037851020
MPDFDPEQLVDVSELATLCEITPQRLRQVLTAHKVPRPEHGRVPLRPALRAYLLSAFGDAHRVEMAGRVPELEAEVRRLKSGKAKA